MSTQPADPLTHCLDCGEPYVQHFDEWTDDGTEEGKDRIVCPRDVVVVDQDGTPTGEEV